MKMKDTSVQGLLHSDGSSNASRKNKYFGKQKATPTLHVFGMGTISHDANA
jgi:hypothetical protein